MKILVVKLSSLGDLFHALPAVHNVKVGTGAEIHWVTSQQYADLVKCFDDVTRVIPFQRKKIFSALGAFSGELRKEEYDYVLDMQGLAKSAIVARLARAKKRIGPSFHREGSRFLYTAVTGPRNKNRHAVEENLDMVKYLGLELIEPEFPVTFPETPIDGKRPCVGLVPRSRWVTKNWPVSCFIEVAKRLKTVRDASIYLIGSPNSVDDCAEIEQALDGDVVNLAGKTSLIEMGSALKGMDLLVSNDSGPIHIAAAAGTPCLVVFGPTDPVRTGPYGPTNRVAKASVPCQPCFSRTCRKEGVPCLSGVTPERVGEMALEMLGNET